METYIEAMISAGIPAFEIPEDGNIHRFGKKNSCWGVNHGFVAVFGDFRSGVEVKWFANGNKHLTQDEKARIEKTFEAVRLDRIDSQNKAAERAKTKLNKLPVNGSSQYLERKKIEAFGVKFCGNTLVVPLRDIEEKLTSLQFINEDGEKRFLSGGKKQGCFHVIGSLEAAEIAYIAEGYATAASVHMATEKPVVVAFDAGNIIPVIESITTKYPSLNIIVAADNDQFNEYGINIGKQKAEEAAEKYGVQYILPEFPEELIARLKAAGDIMPTDFNDLHVHCDLEVVTSQLNIQNVASNIDKKPVLPSPYILKKDGLYYEEDWICSPLEIVSYTRDENSENWGRLIRIENLDGYIHEHAIPMDMFSGDNSEFYGLVLSLGLTLTSKKSDRSKLPDFIQRIKLEKRALCTNKTGWYKEHFMLPDGAIPATDEFYLQSENGRNEGFCTAGSLKDWQENVAALCKGNSRLIFALSSAFAAPLLPLINSESGGFNLKGSSSIGKSTALSVAASVWGSPKYIQQWRTTDNALESIAALHNNCLLCLDEVSQTTGNDPAAIIYMLANGSGKNRSQAKGVLRRKHSWNLLFLSTGEISIADKINEAGKKANAGIMARIADIPADAGCGLGIFEDIGGYKDGSKFSDAIKENTAKYYGTAIREFLKHVVINKNELPHMIKSLQDDFNKTHLKEASDGQVHRVAARFATIASAGELAITTGILPYNEGAAYEATGKCFIAWLEARGSSGSLEIDEGIKQVRRFFELHHSSRFETIGNDYESDSSNKIINQAGYKRRAGGGYEFFVFPEVFRKEICSGYDSSLILKTLSQLGILVRGNERQYLKEQRLPVGKKKIYHLDSKILAEGEEA
jgi:putative DNA primase/helicase